MQPLQQFLEHAAGIILIGRAGRESAAQRSGDSGLVGQAFNTDDTPFHGKLVRRLLQVSIAGHQLN